MQYKQTIKIGITGGICSGKSLVGKCLERYGIGNMDTTETINALITTQPKFAEKAIAHFGEEVLDRNGRLSVKKMSSIIMTTTEQQSFMDEMIYSKVREEIKRFLYSPIGTAIRCVQFPWLFETHTEHLYDEVWTVRVDSEIQKERLMHRDELSEFEAEERIRAFWPQDVKVELSKRVIDNTGDRFKTEQQVMTALNDIKRKLMRPSPF